VPSNVSYFDAGMYDDKSEEDLEGGDIHPCLRERSAGVCEREKGVATKRAAKVVHNYPRTRVSSMFKSHGVGVADASWLGMKDEKNEVCRGFAFATDAADPEIT
jgi:hypothetical protein